MAQIHLMLSDRPLVLYKDRDNENGGIPKASSVSAKEAEAAALEWKKQREGEDGLKVNLNDWMNNG